MANAAKRKGDNFEREIERSLFDLLGIPVRRALGAGRRDDIGDIVGLESTVIQCANYTSIQRAVSDKLPKCEEQQARAGATFGATFVRRKGGGYIVVLTPSQFATYVRESLAPVRAVVCDGDTGKT